MPYTITVAEVKDGFSTSASDSSITAYITLVDQADACMTAQGVPDAIGQQLKILAVRHLLTSERDGGAIMSERAVSGASRSFGQFKAGETGYLNNLKMLDKWGCVYGVVSNNTGIGLLVVGRNPDNQSTY